ncbi:MAG: winged helix-turn-helix domain-containing protein [Candidatus Bathyarchaeota archaeon]|nr:winged helix-turn-helix domain-containing protein [Candidatus Bathyarchaeota archaeon]
MKLIKLLDQEGTKIVADSINQSILQNLVTSDCSVSELSRTLNIPTLKLWRRIQKLQKANLIEVTKTTKVRNFEQKHYRATATQYIPCQHFNYQPKDPNLKAASEIYAKIQKQMITATAAFDNIPDNTDPIDYTLYVQMQTFTQICTNPETQTQIADLQQKLSKFKTPK